MCKKNTFLVGLITLLMCLFFSSQGKLFAQNQQNIIAHFKNPSVDAKPMARWWFPSADAKESIIREQMEALYAGGFGGVEVALVPHYTKFDAKIDGWGTEKWKNLMKMVLKTAQTFPTKFKVDFTITAHWPPALNTIDPNDNATSQELSYTYIKIGNEKTINLPLPKTKIKDRDGNDFIFTDTFVGASIAQVKSVDDNKIILDFSTMKKVPQPTMGDFNSLAGIPENSTHFGNKPKLKNKQLSYKITLPDSLLQKIKPEQNPKSSIVSPQDWLLFAYYHRGTGETISGVGMMNLFLPMADGMYATDYYSTQGSNAIIDFWQKNLLNDPELVALLKKTEGDIFEDSIESFSYGPFWANDYLSEFTKYRKYDLLPYLPFIASLKGSKTKFLSSEANQKNFQDDYHQTLNDLYIDEHLKTIQDWTHTFGYGYRAQAYGASIETSGASAILDVSEGESLGFNSQYDHFRNIAAGVHVADKKFVSDEALADLGATYKLTWKSAAKTLNNNFAAGVNRVIFHGTSYPIEPSNTFNAWPGWHPFQAAFAEPWDKRQIYWNDVNTFTNFVARTQAILQNGKPQIDIAIYKSQMDYGTGFQELLDHGFSYDILGTPLLNDDLRLMNGELGIPKYKCLILNNIGAVSKAVETKISALAKAGFPIIVFGKLPFSVLENMHNVIQISKSEDLIQTLNKLNVSARAATNQAGLRTQCRRDTDGSIYYYLFNTTDKNIETNISFEGIGKPYTLNVWSGNIAQITDYQSDKKRVTTKIGLEPNGSLVVRIGGLLPNTILSKQIINQKFEQKHTMPIKENWNLKLESWAPSNRPFASIKTIVAFEKIELGTWDKLKATPEMLKQLGVDSMAHVSGIGNYSTNFNMDNTWKIGQNTLLKISNSDDMIASVTINGTEIKGIDPATNTLQIGQYLKAKNNELKIKLVTTLINRVAVEHEIFKGGFALPPPPQGVSAEKPEEGDEPPMGIPDFPKIKNKFNYGIQAVELIF